jgi:hypothetical protein
VQYVSRQRDLNSYKNFRTFASRNNSGGFVVFRSMQNHNVNNKPRSNKKNKNAQNAKIFWQNDCGGMILYHLATIILLDISLSNNCVDV